MGTHGIKQIFGNLGLDSMSRLLVQEGVKFYQRQFRFHFIQDLSYQE